LVDFAESVKEVEVRSGDQSFFSVLDVSQELQLALKDLDESIEDFRRQALRVMLLTRHH
jgi:hypothetical protein